MGLLNAFVLINKINFFNITYLILALLKHEPKRFLFKETKQPNYLVD